MKTRWLLTYETARTSNAAATAAGAAYPAPLLRTPAGGGVRARSTSLAEAGSGRPLEFTPARVFAAYSRSHDVKLH